MNEAVMVQFAVHLFSALSLGAVVGLERQWRQRMAGTRTNALVAAGAAAYVMAGTQLAMDPTAAGRVASYVVSGVGFLGAGVIFKDGGNVQGLNTAATIWCSAAIGVLSGLGYLPLALLLTLAVLLTNIALRPLARRMRPVLTTAGPAPVLYEIAVTCRSGDEPHLRTMLLGAITQAQANLQAMQCEPEEGERTRLRAEVVTRGAQEGELEKIAVRLSMEPGVTSLNWSQVPTALE